MKTRAQYVRCPAIFVLERECMVLRQAFGATCYLVGSALKTVDYNDVDIRMIMGDEEYARLFGDSISLIWNLLCTLISRDLSEKSGERVDFQIQSMEHANKRHPGLRYAMGLYVGGEALPDWHGDKR